MIDLEGMSAGEIQEILNFIYFKKVCWNIFWKWNLQIA